jgi:outer membrane protein OmpA-like peptidoglycan-associated protein
MNSMKPCLVAGALVFGSMLAACSTPLEPMQSGRGPQLPSAGPTGEYHVTFPDEGPAATRYIRLTLGDDMAKDCGLVQSHFEFDSAEPLPQDKATLKALAECLDRPKYTSVQLSLVGRADNRGTSNYNEALAMRRAERVKKILVDAGMNGDRISTVSRGDRGAVGGENLVFSYGYDRRVDAVSELVHAPR